MKRSTGPLRIGPTIFGDILRNPPKVLRSIRAVRNELERIGRVRGPINLKRPKRGWVAVDEAWVYVHPNGKIDVVAQCEGRCHIVELPPRIARLAALRAPAKRKPKPKPRPGAKR